MTYFVKAYKNDTVMQENVLPRDTMIAQYIGGIGLRYVQFASSVCQHGVDRLFVLDCDRSHVTSLVMT